MSEQEERVEYVHDDRMKLACAEIPRRMLDKPSYSMQASREVATAAAWLAEQIKATNGHERYVLGFVAQIGLWMDDGVDPMDIASTMFYRWKGERVTPMLDGEVVDAPQVGGTRSAKKTITIKAARRLLAFVREHYPLDVKSEHAPGMTYGQGADVLEKCIPKHKEDTAPISRELAWQIQCFAGVEFSQRVHNPSP